MANSYWVFVHRSDWTPSVTIFLLLLLLIVFRNGSIYLNIALQQLYKTIFITVTRKSTTQFSIFTWRPLWDRVKRNGPTKLTSEAFMTSLSSRNMENYGVYYCSERLISCFKLKKLLTPCNNLQTLMPSPFPYFKLFCPPPCFHQPLKP